MRPAFDALPVHVRGAVEAVLGWPVREALSQSGGFSPGVAARLRGPQGQRAFVKAVSAEVNAQAPTMHRREAEVAPWLPASLGSPGLLGVHDDGTWVALVQEEVDGRPPTSPWVRAELDAALVLLARLAEEPAPAGLLPVAADPMTGWHELASGDVELPEWEAAQLERLCALEDQWPQAVDGDRLVHLDVRDDNLLVRPDGTAVLVDWPWACAGDPVLDLVAFAPSVALNGGPSPEELLQLSQVGRRADPERVTVVVAALAGLFRSRSLRPPEPGMGAVRDLQAAQARICLAWLRVRAS